MGINRLCTKGLAASLGALLLVTGCGSGDSEQGEDAPAAKTTFGGEVDPAVNELVPSELLDRPIVNAIYNDAPPQEFLKDGELVGVNVDLSNALAEVMGVEMKIEAIGNFDTLIPSLQSGRYDMAVAGFGVTKEREEVVDFVVTMELGTAFATKTGSSLSFEDGLDMCGHSVGLLAGSYFLPQADELSAACEEAGEEPLVVQKYPTQSAAIIAVGNGRVEAYGASVDQIAFLAEDEASGIAAQPFVYQPLPQGLGVPKDSELTPAIVAGLKALVENGTYQEIMDQWGLGAAAIPAEEVVSSPVPGAM